MKELLERWKTLKISVIFYEQTDDFFVQMFRYVFVGGIAFAADWGMMVFLHEVVNINVYVATAIAFIFGLIVNFVLSKIFVFVEPSERTGIIGELGITENKNIIYDCQSDSSSYCSDMEFCG